MGIQRDPECSRACAGKVRYPSAYTAGQGAERLFQATGHFAEVYECRCCSGFHIGGARFRHDEKPSHSTAARSGSL